MAYLKEHTGRSLKTSKVSLIERYICEKIDENQDIRRLCRYMTLDPTEMIALDYDNNVVEQPDLKDSLTKPVKHDKVSSGCEERIIIPLMFSGEVVESLHPYIYVYCDQISFATEREGVSAIGSLFFTIDIVYDMGTEELADWTRRSWAIAGIIMDLFDEVVITDSEYAEQVGNLKFMLSSNNIRNIKMAPNTTMGVLTIPFVVATNGGRY